MIRWVQGVRLYHDLQYARYSAQSFSAC